LNDPGVDPLYHSDELWRLSLWHVGLSVTATLLATAVALCMAILVTRSRLERLRPLSQVFMNLSQTVPPIVVLALVIPVLGFGNTPTLVALSVYGMLPIFERSVTGFEHLSPSMTMAAIGLGLTPIQRLWRVELPLALPYVMEGVRLSLTINIGTATLGSTVAAKSLGEVILAGLLSNNNAYIAQGAVITGLLAMLLYDVIKLCETRLLSRAR
jgi:osmoprotectant transport system permease protein